MIYKDTTMSYNFCLHFQTVCFKFFSFISAVLMVDDDLLISAQDLVFAFSVWQVMLLHAL